MRPLPKEPWPRACLQVYTGDGKGKTTAAFGLALRAAGHGIKSFIGQFMKGVAYGENPAAALVNDYITVEQFGSPECIPWREKPAAEDLALAERGLERVRHAMLGGEYGVVVLDEVNVAVHFNLLDEPALLELVGARPAQVELVCTGRYAPHALLEQADLVTEMKAIKHPFTLCQLPARDGIER